MAEGQGQQIAGISVGIDADLGELNRAVGQAEGLIAGIGEAGRAAGKTIGSAFTGVEDTLEGFATTLHSTASGAEGAFEGLSSEVTRTSTALAGLGSSAGGALGTLPGEVDAAANAFGALAGASEDIGAAQARVAAEIKEVRGAIASAEKAYRDAGAGAEAFRTEILANVAGLREEERALQRRSAALTDQRGAREAQEMMRALREDAEATQAALAAFDADFGAVTDGAASAQGDLQGLAAAAERAGLSLADLRDVRARLDAAFMSAGTADERREIAALAEQYDRLEQEMRQAAGGTAGFARGSGLASNVAMELGRGLGDLRYGFHGVANNAEQMVSQFGMLVRQSGGTRAALAQVGAALTGPVGLVIGFSALTALGPSVINFFRSTSGAARDADKAYRDALEGLITFNREQFKPVELQSVAEGEARIESLTGRIEELRSAIREYRIASAQALAQARSGIAPTDPEAVARSAEALRRLNPELNRLTTELERTQTATDALRLLGEASSGIDETTRAIRGTVSESEAVRQAFAALQPELDRLAEKRRLGVIDALGEATEQARIYGAALDKALEAGDAQASAVPEALARAYNRAQAAVREYGDALRQANRGVGLEGAITSARALLGLLSPLAAATAHADQLDAALEEALRKDAGRITAGTQALAGRVADARQEVERLTVEAERMQRALDLSRALAGLSTAVDLGVTTALEAARREAQALEAEYDAVARAAKGVRTPEVEKAAEDLEAVRSRAAALARALDLQGALRADLSPLIRTGVLTPLEAAEEKLQTLTGLLRAALNPPEGATGATAEEIRAITEAVDEQTEAVRRLRMEMEQAEAAEVLKEALAAAGALGELGIIGPLQQAQAEAQALEAALNAALKASKGERTAEVEELAGQLRDATMKAEQLRAVMGALSAGIDTAAAGIADAFTDGAARLFGALSAADQLTLINLAESEARLREAFAEGTISAEEFRVRMEAINAERDRLATGLAALPQITRAAFGSAKDALKAFVRELIAAAIRAAILKAILNAIAPGTGGFLGVIRAGAEQMQGMAASTNVAAEAASAASHSFTDLAASAGTVERQARGASSSMLDAVGAAKALNREVVALGDGQRTVFSADTAEAQREAERLAATFTTLSGAYALALTATSEEAAEAINEATARARDFQQTYTATLRADPSPVPDGIREALHALGAYAETYTATLEVDGTAVADFSTEMEAAALRVEDLARSVARLDTARLAEGPLAFGGAQATLAVAAEPQTVAVHVTGELVGHGSHLRGVIESAMSEAGRSGHTPTGARGGSRPRRGLRY